jgi:putative flippase GtrA
VNQLTRWLKFNLVGLMGVGVQLSTLFLLNRWRPSHYLYNSAIVVEFAVVHNFTWHLHYTWRDRRNDSPLLTQLLRFHLSNGAVSLFGNLALMRILHQTRLPLIASNAIAILCCSLINFYLGDSWAFPSSPKSSQYPAP